MTRANSTALLPRAGAARDAGAAPVAARARDAADPLTAAAAPAQARDTARPTRCDEIRHALLRLPLAAALGAMLALRPKRTGTPPRQVGRDPDPDHPRGHGGRRDAGRRQQPGARLRRRRRRRPGALPREDRGPEGRRRHAVDAGGRPRVRRRPVRDRVVLGGLHPRSCSGSSSRSSPRARSCSSSRSRWATTPTAAARSSTRSCSKFQVDFDLLTSSDEEVCYEVHVPLELQIGTALRTPCSSSIPRAMRAVEWDEKRNPRRSEADHPARRRRRARRAGHRKSQKDHRHRHLPLRPPGGREGARRGGRARRRGAGADRAHQQGRREEPAQARAAAARGRRHGGADRRRPRRATTAR